MTVIDLTRGPEPAPAGITHADVPVDAVPVRGRARRSAPLRRFRPDIQGLRAIAVLLVVLYHAGLPGIRGGYVGVDVFFVISGFLITRALYDEVERSGRLSLIGFYGRRVRRLLPPAVLVVTVCVLVARAVLPYAQVVSLLRDVRYTAAYAINYHLAAEGINYQQAAAPPSPLQHFWSLAVEEQFYVVWPLLILVCALIGRRRGRRALMLLVVGALSAVTFWYSVTRTAGNTPMAYFSIQTRAWELGLGALVALSGPVLGRIRGGVAATLSWAGLAMVATSAVLFTDRTLYPGSAAALPVVGTALVIAAGANATTGSAESVLLQRPWMQYIGKVSYAWYLWHWPMLILLPAWAGHPLSLGGRLEGVVIAFWFAVLTHFLEDASHRSGWSLRRWVPVGLGLSASTVALALVIGTSLPPLVGTGTARAAATLKTADISTVQAALTRSMRIHALPRNLTPALTRIPEDLPVSSGDGCHAALLQSTARGCTYGDPTATRTMVLLGDSHAQQWLGALIPDARAAHWKIVAYTKAACSIADIPLWSSDLNRPYTECATWRTQALAQIQALRPALIVASQSNGVPWNTVSDSTWATKTVASLQRLVSKGTRVIYIGDTPQTAADPTPCLQQHVNDAIACAYPRAKAYTYFPNRHTVLRNAVTAAGFGYVDPLDFFCGAMCPAVVDNMVVRRDPGHITNTYATWLAPMLTPIFKDPT